MDTPLLEARIRAIGEELARRSAGRSPGLFDSRWWSQAAINLAMKDPAFKAQLFRFIDVLPALSDDTRVVRLAEEYFGDVSPHIFGLQWGMKALSATNLGASLTGKTIRHQVEQMARTFIAGDKVTTALPALRTLWDGGRAFSVDLLGEATVSEREAERYAAHCLGALQELADACRRWPESPLLERDHLGPLPRVQLSIKISALYSQLDPIDPDGSYRAVAARLRPLIDLAMKLPASLIFDMEQAETKDLILGIFRRLFEEQAYRGFPYAGIALQAYRIDTERDVKDVIAWCERRGTPITVRLVKGAYWDSDTVRYRQRGWPPPLFERKADTDLNYESLVQVLLNHTGILRPAFGTHNLRSLAVIETAAERLKLPPDAWEYQMIFGMAEPFQHAITSWGRRLRLYAPVGELLPGMAYLVRRLLENTSNESFLRKEYVESQPLAALLAKPVGSPTEAGLSSKHTIEDEDTVHAMMRNEPAADFSREEARAAMRQALALVRSKLGGSIHQPEGAVRPSGPEAGQANPSDPTHRIATYHDYNPNDVPRLVERAAAQARDWADRPAEERIAIVKRAATLLCERRWETAAWEVFEEGKPWREADADLAEAIDFLEYYASQMERLARPQRLGRYPGEQNDLVWSPRGLTAVIAPWNFPLAIPTGMVAAALVTGNPVLFKPSERSTAVGYRLAELFHDAGVPSGVLQCVPGGPELGRALVTAPEVATIAFTGSKDAGRWILQAAATPHPDDRCVKRVIAEMGGKNAIIVDDTADLDEAVLGVVASFTGYAGQKCSACSRAVVLDSIYDAFTERLVEAVHSLRIGAAEEPGTQVGPLIDAKAAARVRQYIDLGRQEGRVLVDRSGEGPGYCVGPVVFGEIESRHRLAQEEIFGPVLSVMRAKSIEAAIVIANGTAYALTGGVYSRSPRTLELVRRTFDVGNLYLNRSITGALVARQPFGGHRLSGVGAKAGGEDYLKQFMVARVISENTLRRGFTPTL